MFSYLRDCPGSFDVKLGDGRRSLERRQDGEFGLIVLDAFNSAAVPVHLLTRQAIDVYAHKLSPNGVMAFQISNPHLDLGPVLGNVAAANRLSCYRQGGWVAMARKPADLGRVVRDKRWQLCPSDADARAWTDDYSNVTAALRLG